MLILVFYSWSLLNLVARISTLPYPFHVIHSIMKTREIYLVRPTTTTYGC